MALPLDLEVATRSPAEASVAPSELGRLFARPAPLVHESSGDESQVAEMFMDLDAHSSPPTSYTSAQSSIYKVMDGLWIGGYRDFCDAAAVKAANITAFLCVAKEYCDVLPTVCDQSAIDAGAVKYRGLPLEDRGRTSLRHAMHDVYAFLDECRSEERVVGLYCAQGRSRSVSFALAYLMRQRRIDLDTALRELDQYGRCEPNLHFVLQLRELSEDYSPRSNDTSLDLHLPDAPESC